MTSAKKRPNPPAKAAGSTGTATKPATKGSSAAKPASAKTVADGTQAKGAARRGPQPAPKRKFPVLPVVFAGVALALIAAIVFSSDQSINAETGTPEVTGEALPPYATGVEPAADEAVGTQAPAVTGEDFGGNAVSIEPGDGTPRAVVFLAHWCPHCQAEVPRVQQWLDAGGGVDGVEIVSVATSMNTTRENYPPSEWLEREGWTPEVIRDSDAAEVYTSYGGGAFPYYVFVDGEGNVVRRSSGELDVATLEQYMQEIAG